MIRVEQKGREICSMWSGSTCNGPVQLEMRERKGEREGKKREQRGMNWGWGCEGVAEGISII